MPSGKSTGRPWSGWPDYKDGRGKCLAYRMLPLHEMIEDREEYQDENRASDRGG